MRPIATMFLFSLLLVASFSHARKDPAGDYWRMVMKGQPIPEALRDLMIRPGSGDGHRFVKDFDIRPNVIIYHTHANHKDSESADVKSLKSAELRLKVPGLEQKDHESSD